MSDERIALALPADVIFEYGSARLSEGGGRSAIAQIAKALVTLADRRFQVEGHTDNVPIKNARFPSNWQLRPAASNDEPEGRGANRRIEIVLVPDLSSLPGYEELEALVRER